MSSANTTFGQYEEDRLHGIPIEAAVHFVKKRYQSRECIGHARELLIAGTLVPVYCKSWSGPSLGSMKKS